MATKLGFSALIALIKMTFVVTCFALSQTPLKAGVLLDGSGNDAANDAFGSKNFDLLSMFVDVSNSAIVFRLKFAEVISLDLRDSNYVAGYLDLDLDRDVTTDLDGLRLPGRSSGGSNSEFYADGSGENFFNASLGADLYIDLFPSLSGAGLNQVDIVDVRGGNVFLGFADLSLDVSKRELSIEIDPALFASPVVAGNFNFGVIIGAIPTSVDPFASDVAVSISGASPPAVPEPSSVFAFAVTAVVFVRLRSRK
jgi:hypothetical protein